MNSMLTREAQGLHQTRWKQEGPIPPAHGVPTSTHQKLLAVVCDITELGERVTSTAGAARSAAPQAITQTHETHVLLEGVATTHEVEAEDRQHPFSIVLDMDNEIGKMSTVRAFPIIRDISLQC